MKPFSKWSVPEIEEEFQLTLDPDFPGLRSWLQGASEATPEEISQLQHLSKKLALRVRDWNEEELKISFIALVLDMIDFYDVAYRPFMEREVSVEYADNKKLWGIIDFLVAQGKHAPKEQFFFNKI